MERMIESQSATQYKQKMWLKSINSKLQVLLISSSFACVGLTYAEESAPAAPATPSQPGMVGSAMDSTLDWFGFNHTKVDGLHTFYVGVGDTNSLLHANVEMPTRFGHVYAKVGKFSDGKSIAGQVGFRMPYLYTNEKDNDGVYFGAYAGDIVNSGIAGEHRNRLGGALEMSYLFMNQASLTAISVSVGAAQREKDGNPDQQKVTPIVMFGLSWGFGVF
jgi:hypothetical protein